MQPLEVSGAVRPLEWSLGVKGLIPFKTGIQTRSGPRGGAVEALRYKLEGLGFDSPLCHFKFSLT